MRSNHYGHRLGPGSIACRIDCVRLRFANIENAGEDEILESFVLVAKGACVPAEAVESQGVRRHPAPLRLWLRHGLIANLERTTLANRAEDSLEGSRVDAPAGSGHDLEFWRLVEPSLLRPDRAAGDGTQLSEVAVRILDVEDGPKFRRRQIALEACIVDHVGWRQLLVAREVCRRLRCGNTELVG